MKNFFNAPDKEVLLKRIENLTPDSNALWGEMNVNEMFCHLSDQLRLALGIKKSPAEGPFFFKTQLVIFFALYIVPWRKAKEVSPTYMNKDINGTKTTGFKTDKIEFISLLNQFYNSKENSLHPHPFFGNFSHRQWGRMIAKHLNHHLKQFGV